MYSLSWLVVLLFPMLAAVQTIAATIGAACKTSVQGAIRARFGLAPALLALVMVVAVNIFTLTADMEAAGVSLTLLTGVPYQWFVLPFAALVAWLLVAHRYSRIERALSFLPFIFLAYGGSAILAHADWGRVLHAIVVPEFHLNPAFVGGALALLGTTLTSYVYIWESIEIAERAPRPSRLGIVRLDAVLGMLLATITFAFILVATGATLGTHHIAVETAADAALALKPLAGPWASALFAIGLLGSALVAVPVIAATTGYVVAQTFGWKGTLDADFPHARRFYVVIFASLAVAALLSLVGASPISLLYWASLGGGVATPVTLFFAVRIARDKTMMGEHRIGPWLGAAGWLVTALITASAILFFATVAWPAR
ncbi:MAG: divalent metal cation transporter [Candidatus Eremiobacteraeota bacterium]|nr:divalent metal cation transporter [Candidatus Eremiobacteraeota bacterium]